MSEGATNRVGFSAIGGRKAKAEKIAAILAAAGWPLKPDDKVLDLGCGSGEIAAYLADFADLVCADAVDQRTSGRELPFVLADQVERLADASFDVVVSNHVIEHTIDRAAHIALIERVLRRGGVAYLATPNRWWPWEVHARLPLLHYLPWRLFSQLGMAVGRLDEPVRLLSLMQLKALARQRLSIDIWHHRVLKRPTDFALRLTPFMATILAAVPERLLRATAALQPTLIVLLRHK